jgi:hypothetical protein
VRRDYEFGDIFMTLCTYDPMGWRRYLSGSILKVFSSCSRIASAPPLQSVRSCGHGQTLCLLHIMSDVRRQSVP